MMSVAVDVLKVVAVVVFRIVLAIGKHGCYRPLPVAALTLVAQPR